MTDINPDTRRWLNRDQVAKRLGISLSTVDRLRRPADGMPARLPVYFVGVLPRFRIEDVDQLLTATPPHEHSDCPPTSTCQVGIVQL